MLKGKRTCFRNLKVAIHIRPPRAPWGPLDSGLMRMMMMMMKVFTLLILNGHKKMAISFLKGHLVLQGAPRCSKVLYPGFALPGF